jgi:hypothetical protein
MTIVVRLHDALSLQTVCFSQCVTYAQLLQLYEFHCRNRNFAATDTVSTISPQLEFGALTKDQLDDVRARYGALHSSIEFFMLRRSGWVCQAPGARATLDYWLSGRHSRDGQSAEVSIVARLEDLATMFAPLELQALSTMEGFRTLLEIRGAPA